MEERNKVVISLKDGTIWTQIFDKKGEVVSSFISEHEIEALQKAKKFLQEHTEYCIVHPKLDNYSKCVA